jgi:hypothetical protein
MLYCLSASEKTVINSVITSVSLQPPSMNFCVIKSFVMRKNTNTSCRIALQVKLYELYGSLGSNEQQIHTYT